MPPFLARLFFGDKAAPLMRSRGANAIVGLPDRLLMAQAYIPAFAADGGRILAVGVRAYNLEDHAPLQAQGAELWTTDIDARAARWGVAGRHRTGDACDLDKVFGDLTFDAVLCNGVLGHGVDTPEQQKRALDGIATILRPGGRLLLGWNTGRIDDPLAAGFATPAFRPEPYAGEPARVTFDTVDHVYDLMVRTDAAPA